MPKVNGIKRTTKNSDGLHSLLLKSRACAQSRFHIIARPRIHGKPLAVRGRASSQAASQAGTPIAVGLFADMAVAEHNEFLGGESLQADRSARMKLIGRDTDLGAQTIFETVGKTR